MAKILWTNEFGIGIEVIDNQHRRIVDYINQLNDANSGAHSREEIGILINELVDYTVSHFGFEEHLQMDAGYPYYKAHLRVHSLFTRRVTDFIERFENGEDITRDLHGFLVNWLLSHIKHEDADYVEVVNEYLHREHGYVEKKKGFFFRLFEET
jgi:hemerythrin